LEHLAANALAPASHGQKILWRCISDKLEKKSSIYAWLMKKRPFTVQEK
jgi:hypothetical protein